MVWEKGTQRDGSPDPYFITSGKLTISKTFSENKASYSLWYGRVMIGIFESLNEAKREADIIA